MATHSEDSRFYFLIAVLLGTALLFFFIFRPFLYTLILAIVFAVVFEPLHRRILAKMPKYRGLASFITAILIIVIIGTPLAFLGTQIFLEARDLYSSIVDHGDRTGLINSLVDNIHKNFPATQEYTIDSDKYVRDGLDWLLGNVGSFFSNFAHMLVSAFVFLISLYYLLKDGDDFKKMFIAFSPLTDTDDETIFRKLKGAISSVIRGNLLIALIQGVLTSIGFAVFGIPNPVLWGTVAAVAALIPGIGTALVITPGVLFLFFTSDLLSAFGLLLWGILAVGLIDNFLGPKLIGSGLQLHPLVVFLAVLGGIAFFGPLGVLLGPLAASLLFALFDIYFAPRRGIAHKH